MFYAFRLLMLGLKQQPRCSSGFDTRGGCAVRYPPGPDGSVIYLVGDIHGRVDLLVEMQRRIDEDKARLQPRRSLEVYLGDYIDRGPDSAAVVARLIARGSEIQAVFLRGNHEQLLLDFLGGGDCLPQWAAVGGFATLLSYGVAPRLLALSVSAEAIRHSLRENLPHEHLRFYEQTGLYSRLGPYLAVHAGIKPGTKLEDQTPADLLGIRRQFLQHDGDFGFIVVHGHTPVREPELRHNRINIDTGAFATNRLTCLRIGADGAQILAHGDHRASQP
jgi:serine/threonine protein phosphatase 1